MNDKITLLYDKDCPICNTFACDLNKAPNIETVNARISTPYSRAAKQKSLHIDDGAIAFYKNKTYFGADAVFLIANHTQARGITGIVNTLFFKNRLIADKVYPYFVQLRKALLRYKKIPLIETQRKP